MAEKRINGGRISGEQKTPRQRSAKTAQTMTPLAGSISLYSARRLHILHSRARGGFTRVALRRICRDLGSRLVCLLLLLCGAAHAASFDL